MSSSYKWNRVKKQLEICLVTNCLSCALSKGNYKECSYFPYKKKAVEVKRLKGNGDRGE